MEHITLENAVVHKICLDFVQRNNIDFSKYTEEKYKRYEERDKEYQEEYKARNILRQKSDELKKIDFSAIEEAMNWMANEPKANYFRFEEDCLLERVKMYLESSVLGEGVMMLEHDSASFLGKIKNEDISTKYKEWMDMNYVPNTFYRDLLSKENEKSDKPEGPPTVIVSTPLPSPWWIIVGVVVFVAALVAGSMA